VCPVVFLIMVACMYKMEGFFIVISCPSFRLLAVTAVFNLFD